MMSVGWGGLPCDPTLSDVPGITMLSQELAGIEQYLRAALWRWLLPLPIQVGANSVGSQVSSDAAIRIHIRHLH